MFAQWSSSLPSARRITAIAGVTLTQLLRMRLFLVMGGFALALLALQFLPFHATMSVEYAGVNQLELIKNICMGAMQLFGVVFCVASTALIIPRDVEDRTLYTILSKPVPRLDYLLGKAFGVLGLMLMMLLLMDGMMMLVLWIRETTLQGNLLSYMQQRNMSMEEMQPYFDALSAAGNSWDLQASLLAMAMGWCILTSMTLLISCFTSGTIVSLVFALSFYFLGLFQTQFFEALVAGSGIHGVTESMQYAAHAVSVLIPNFSLFSLTDTAAAGVPVSFGVLGGLAAITAAYFCFHLLLAAWLFGKKEF